MPEPAAGADEAEIRNALRAVGFKVPEEADFKELGSGVYQFDAAMAETQEAYDKIVNGECIFWIYGDNKDLEVQVASCSLVYALDSKGYYQPNHQFQCTINGEEIEIVIPALKN